MNGGNKSKKPFDPQSTAFTNLMLDEIMPRVSPNAWKILCLAMRKTAGWADLSTYSQRKESDIISISQFRDGCGIGSNTTVEEAIKECVDAGYLLQEKEGKSFRYRLNVDYELAENTITVSVNDSITVSVNETITDSVKTNNKTINNKKTRSSESYKKDIEKSIAIGMVKGGNGLSFFPEDVRPVLDVFIKLWNMRLPRGKQIAYWIAGARDLLDACGEMEAQVLYELREDFERYMSTHGGLAPYTVASPQSLVNPARAKAGLMRDKNKNKDKPAIPLGAAEVWIGGVKYE